MRRLDSLILMAIHLFSLVAIYLLFLKYFLRKIIHMEVEKTNLFQEFEHIKSLTQVNSNSCHKVPSPLWVLREEKMTYLTTVIVVHVESVEMNLSVESISWSR